MLFDLIISFLQDIAPGLHRFLVLPKVLGSRDRKRVEVDGSHIISFLTLLSYHVSGGKTNP